VSDIGVVRVKSSTPAELVGEAVAPENWLQNHIDRFLGVRFRAVDYSAGKTKRGVRFVLTTVSEDFDMTDRFEEPTRAVSWFSQGDT
jgi:hypothetical protein